MGLANHIGQTCNTSRLARPSERRALPCPGNRYDLAGEIDRGSTDRQGPCLCCVVEAREKAPLARLRGANPRACWTGTPPPHVVARTSSPMRRPGGIVPVVTPLSPRRGRLYPPALVSSNAPRARSD